MVSICSLWLTVGGVVVVTKSFLRIKTNGVGCQAKQSYHIFALLLKTGTLRIAFSCGGHVIL